MQHEHGRGNQSSRMQVWPRCLIGRQLGKRTAMACSEGALPAEHLPPQPEVGGQAPQRVAEGGGAVVLKPKVAHPGAALQGWTGVHERASSVDAVATSAAALSMEGRGAQACKQPQPRTQLQVP